MNRKNWEYVPEEDSGENKITAEEVEKIVERKSKRSVEDERLKVEEKKNIPSIRCFACGFVVSGELWEEYGECPICSDRKRIKAREKIEMKKVAETKKKSKEISREAETMPLKYPVGFAVIVGIIIKVAQKYLG